MFNMDMMRQGAEAFGTVAESVERIADVAYAYAKRDQVPCADDLCDMIAGHRGEHTPLIDPGMTDE